MSGRRSSSLRRLLKTLKLWQASQQRRSWQVPQHADQKATAPKTQPKVKPSPQLAAIGHATSPAPNTPDHYQHCGSSTGDHRSRPGLKDVSHRGGCARHSKSRRRFCDHQSRQRSHLSWRRYRDTAGKRQSPGYALDGAEPERLWHPRNQCAELRGQGGFARMLSHAETGRGRALHAGSSRRHGDGSARARRNDCQGLHRASRNAASRYAGRCDKQRNAGSSRSHDNDG